MLSIDVRFGTTCLRNPREPNASIIQTAMLWIERNAATLGHPVASASKMIVESKRPGPDPPSSSRTVTPPIPVPQPLSASRAEGSFCVPFSGKRRRLGARELERHLAHRALLICQLRAMALVRRYQRRSRPQRKRFSSRPV